MIVKRNEFVKGTDDYGRKYKMLNVSGWMDRESWKSDVDEGAVQFEGCKVALKGNVGRYIIVEAENAEEGFLAVNYLYGMLREKEKGGPEGRAEISGDYDEDYEENGIHDPNDESDECYYDDYEEPRFEEEDYYSDLEYYIEDDDYLPVIDSDELNNECCTKRGFDTASLENMQYAFAPKEYKKPYWMEMGSKPVCIVRDEQECMPFSYFELDNVKIFDHAKHVFILFIRGSLNSGGMLPPFLAVESVDEVDADDAFSIRSPEITKAMLMLTADYVRVSCHEDIRKEYRAKVLASWLKEHKLALADEGELNQMAEKLSGINSDYPSDTMDKSLKLLKHNNPEAKEISLSSMQKLGILAINKAPVDDVSFDDLVGLDQVKDELIRVTHLMKFMKKRKLAGGKVNDYHNVFLFLGAPGTAKTTAAKALGALMRKEGLIKRGKFISVSGSQLKAGYVGHTVDKVRALFRDNDIILIDEAYSIAASNHGEMDTFSQEALAQLAIELEEHADDKVVIFAGYGGRYVTKQDNKMEEFLSANPGIKSRISFEVSFPSYNADDMVKVVHHIAGRRGYRMVHTADELIRNYFELRLKDSTFGNGREARVLVENMERQLAERYYKSDSLPAGNLLITKKDIVETLEMTKKSNDHSKDRSRVFGF